jgi:electron transfer flavoprotein beta subunit
MGPEPAAESIRTALSMGADRAMHLLDDALAGSDGPRAGPPPDRFRPGDLRFGIDRCQDGRDGRDAGRTPGRVPQVSLASKVDIDGTVIRIRRVSDDGYYEVEASLPAVISVVEKINEPRYPSFKGIMAAIDPASVGLAGTGTEVVDFAQRPPRQVGVIVKDDGDGDVKIAEFLAAQKFI